jgi:ribosomal protein S18 acetylase RimI-like enzyme
VRRDAARLNEIELATFEVHRIPLRAFQRLMGKPTAVTLVYEQSSRDQPQYDQAPHISGYARILLRKGARNARLYSLAVSPEARGAGIGSQLLRAAIERITRLGIPFITLEVRSADEAARRFYERFGFTLKDELPCYYDDGADAVRLVLKLC